MKNYLLIVIFLFLQQIVSINSFGKNELPVTDLNQKTSFYYFSDTIFAFEDKSKLLNIQDIIAQGDLIFKNIPNNYFNEFINSAIWFKCAIVPPKDSSVWYFTDFATRTEKYSVFYPDTAGKIIEQKIGATYPFRNNSNEFPNSIKFPFYTKDTIVFYVRCESRTLMYAAFSISSFPPLMQRNISENWVIGILSGCLFILAFYNFFIFILLKDRSYIYYTGYLLMTLLFLLTWMGKGYEFLWPNSPWWHIRSMYSLLALSFFFSTKFSESFLRIKTNLPKYTPYFLAVELCMLSIAVMVIVYPFSSWVLKLNQMAALAGGCLVITAAIHSLRLKQRIAIYFSLAWLPLILAMFTHIILDLQGIPPSITIMGFSYPIVIFASTVEAVFLSLALAYRINIIRKELEAEKAEKRRREREQQLERNKLIEQQKQDLEIQVARRTAELNFSMIKLRDTQKQLVAREKLASLGMLTAGIAHEIQNPLNFVNNFSELSTDLLNELADTKPNLGIMEVVDELKENVDRITFHGKRAEKIVRSMLLHSRDEQEEKFVKANLNEILKQAVTFSYSSFQTIENGFECKITENFDPNLPSIELIEQSISRVIINLLNNAFDAVNQRLIEEREKGNEFKPEIIVSTSLSNDYVFLAIRDNGYGIPDELKDKVFDPFFTTKSAGKGTGLGLSISFDLIVGRHNGEMSLESEIGHYTKFVIKLPVSQIIK